MIVCVIEKRCVSVWRGWLCVWRPQNKMASKLGRVLAFSSSRPDERQSSGSRIAAVLRVKWCHEKHIIPPVVSNPDHCAAFRQRKKHCREMGGSNLLEILLLSNCFSCSEQPEQSEQSERLSEWQWFVLTGQTLFHFIHSSLNIVKNYQQHCSDLLFKKYPVSHTQHLTFILKSISSFYPCQCSTINFSQVLYLIDEVWIWLQPMKQRSELCCRDEVHASFGCCRLWIYCHNEVTVLSLAMQPDPKVVGQRHIVVMYLCP